MAFQLFTGIRQGGDGGVGLGSRSVTAGGFGVEFRVDHALFRNTDEAAGHFHTGEHIFHHGAAFIHHQAGGNPVLGEVFYNVGRTAAVDFFTAGEGKIHILLGYKALADQIIGGGQHAVECGLGVQGATAPHDAVFNDGGEGGLFPARFVYGHHIIVGHHHGGFLRSLAGPAQQQSPSGQPIHGADLKHPGVQRRQQVDQLFKFCVIFLGGVVAGNGFALHQFL